MAFMATALTGTTVSFVACEDDEKPQVQQGNQHDGTYNASVAIGTEVQGKVVPLATVEGQKAVVLTLKANNPVITISGYQTDLPAGAPYKHIAQDQYQLTQLKATQQADGSLAISGEEEVTMRLRMVMGNATVAATPFTDYKTKVRTEGTLKDGKLKLTVKYQPGRMPMAIVYNYTGQR